MKLRDTLIAGAFACSFAACGGAEEAPVEEPTAGENAETIGKGTGKEDAWDYRNDPTRLANFVNKNLTYDVICDDGEDCTDTLPKTGEAANKPWPGSYWPTYEDSTNHRWRTGADGEKELSPLEKYDVAFNDWDASEVQNLRPFNASNCEAGFDTDYYTNQIGRASCRERV